MARFVGIVSDERSWPACSMSNEDVPAAKEWPEEVKSTVEELCNQVDQLWAAVDELMDKVQGAVRHTASQQPPLHLTSMPRDPCADDFGARLNQIHEAQRAALRQEANATPLVEEKQTAGATANNAEPRSGALRSQTGRSSAQSAGGTTAEGREPSQTSTPASDNAPARGKSQPLYMRVYQQRWLTEIVQLVGYETLSGDEARRRLETLRKRYGDEKVLAAVGEVLTHPIGHSDMWQLSDEARRAARALLGPPPTDATSGTPAPVQQSPAWTPPATGEAAPDVQTDRKNVQIKASRKVVLARFREHLASFHHEIVEVESQFLAQLRQRGLMLPDLIIGGDPPMQLIALRRSLTKLQRHDTQQWLRIFGTGYEAVRVWPEKGGEGPDGWQWVFEQVASAEDELDEYSEAEDWPDQEPLNE